jgi:hypothetical protein
MAAFLQRQRSSPLMLGIGPILLAALLLPGRFPAAAAYAAPPAGDPPDKIPRVAVVTTVWYHNSHSDLIAGRLLEGKDLLHKDFPRLKLASLYVDQFPANDKSKPLAQRHGVPLYDRIEKALTLGGETLAVDGVLLIAEHGQYPESDTGQFQFPKRPFFAEIVKVFERSGRVVPVFIDKHVSDTWADVAWIRDEAQRLKIPLMAGSSLPVLWREPAVDVPRDKPLREIVATSYHRLDAYGFHALEMVQCLAERRHGGETGVRQVRCLEGGAVWDAGRDGLFDRALLDEAVRRFRVRPLPDGMKLEEAVRHPVLFVVDYRDGLRASVLTLDGSFSDWAVAWKDDAGRVTSTAFVVQDTRPFTHFGLQLEGIERMIHTGRPDWPVERTVLTSGVLDALLISKRDKGRTVETPYLDVRYRTDWEWKPPPPPPPDRKLDEQ